MARETRFVPFFPGVDGEPEARVTVRVTSPALSVYYGGLINTTLTRTRLHREQAVALHVTNGQEVDLQLHLVDQEFRPTEPFGPIVTVSPDIHELRESIGIELGLDFLEPFIFVVDYPRALAFSVEIDDKGDG